MLTRRSILLLPLPALAGIIDRIAVSVGTQVVTLGMIRRQLRMSAFFRNEEEVDYSPKEMKKAAERLIDQALIRREIELSRYAPVPMAEVDAAIEKFTAARKLDQARLQEALSKYGFSEEEFRQEIHWQLTLLRFLEFRFRPSVQVAPEEIDEYYEQTFLPQYRKSSPDADPPPREEVAERISAIVAANKSNTSLFQWLQSARQQMRVRYHEEVFQ